MVAILGRLIMKVVLVEEMVIMFSNMIVQILLSILIQM
jgi:hypothetical protein